MTKLEIKNTIDKIREMSDPQLLNLFVTAEKELGLSNISAKAMKDHNETIKYCEQNGIYKEGEYTDFCFEQATPAQFILACCNQNREDFKTCHNARDNAYYILDKGYRKYTDLAHNLQEIHPKYLDKLAELLKIKTKKFVPKTGFPEYKSKAGKKIRALDVHSDNWDKLKELIDSSITPNNCENPGWIGIAADHVEDCILYLNHPNQPESEQIMFERGHMLIQNSKGELSWMSKKDFEKEYGKVKNPKPISKYI